jgi:hypothetical protein
VPQVTIIVATFNSSRTLKCALSSICDQTFRDFEVLVIGDCCTDDSEQIVASFGDSRLTWINLKKRFGLQSRPNNEGLRRAGGEYIAYLGHDDLWFPWHLASLVSTIEEQRCDFVHAVTALIDPTGPIGVTGVPGVNRRYANRGVAPPSSWLHRRDIVNMSGWWPERKKTIGACDFVFVRQAALAGKRFACCNNISVLKFPSIWWRSYALTEGHPQPGYIAQMKDNPERLHERLLSELIFSQTRPSEDLSIWQPLKMAAVAIKRRTKDWYGHERWPMPQYLIWKHGYERRRSFPRRGLSQ